MIIISVKSDIEEVVGKWARIAGDQMPFATARALTRTAKLAKDEIERLLPSLIDRPNSYTMKGFRLYPATKTKLFAEVDFRPAFGRGTQARDYLSPLVYGGERKVKAFERSLQRVGLLPTGYGVVPGEAARMDAYGNMSQGQIVQLLSYFNAQGEQGYKSNMTAKGRARLAKDKRSGQRGYSYFIGRPGNGRLPFGIWQKFSFGAVGSNIKPVAMFVKIPSYTKRLDVPGIAERMIANHFADELSDAVDVALRTARPKGSMKNI